MQFVDAGTREWLRHLCGVVLSARKLMAQSQMGALAELASLTESFDFGEERQLFQAAHPNAFALARKFEFRSVARSLQMH